MRIWRSWARRWDERRTREDDLEKELRAHLDLEAEERQEAGALPDEARYAARRAFGNTTRLKEEVRETMGWRWVEQLGQDLRYAFRTLRKNAAFTAVAGLSLALGIGGNAAMFSVVNCLLIRPLPYPDPHRLVRVTEYYPQGALAALQQQSRSMEFTGFSTDSQFNLTGQGEAMRLLGSTVSADFFAVLGVGARLGRTFQAGEDQPGQDSLVVLSHGLWQSKFAGDSGIVGRVITIDGVNRQVVGVMPPDFGFPSPQVQLWIPLHLDPRNSFATWNTGFMPLIARLRPGATLGQARGEIRQLVSGLIPMFPYPMARSWNADATVLPLQQDLVAGVRDKLMVLQCAVGLVLLIACVNVASLLLARATARQREMALRVTLGAGRGRIVRQLLTEGVVLALAGGGLGLGLAFGALSLLKPALPLNTPGWPEATIDARVLAFVTVLALVMGLAFGLAPALSASKPNLAESMKWGGRRSAGGAGARLRSALIASEVVLAVVLTVGAGLLIKSLWLLAQVNPGFRPEHILTARISPNQSLCREQRACVSFYEELRRRAQGITGVSEVTAANVVPLSTEVPAVPAELEGHPLVPGQNLAPMLWAGAITPEYFRLMQIPLLEGRTFTDADGEKSTPIVVVSAATARRFWPGEDPIGKHIRTTWEQSWRTVVGVVGDVRQYDLANNSPGWLSGAIYMPYPQAVGLDGKLPTAMTLMVRTDADSAIVSSRIRELVIDMNPNVPVSEVQTMEAVVSSSTSQSRSMMWLFVSFAASALILAAIGTYGVVSYSTMQRTYEMGVRVALGATKSNIIGLVLSQSLRLVLSGLGLGVLASLALTRMLTRFLYGVTATDPITFLAVAVLLVAMALLAGYFPARRAASIDPLTALRVE